MLQAIIEARGICKRFGGVQALSGVSLTAAPGEVVGLIGPNGAGKSTLVGCITGLIRVDSGAVFFDGLDITSLSPYRRARLGIGRTFQKLRLASGLTVYQNVAAGLLASWFRPPLHDCLRKVLAPSSHPQVEEAVMTALSLTGMAERRDEPVDTLPYGQRHFVEIARALVSRPRVMLLDEPATGMTESDRVRLQQIVARYCAEGGAVILIEHDLELVGRMCHRVTVINHGKHVFTGTPPEVQRHPGVVAVYLGRARLGQGGEVSA